MKKLIYLFCLIVIGGCCGDDCCKEKDVEIQDLKNKLALFESDEQPPAELLGGLFVHLYVVHTVRNSTIYNSQKIMLAVNNDTKQTIPVFIANFDGADTLTYYQEIWGKLALDRSNNIVLTDYTTTKPIMRSQIAEISNDRLAPILKYTADLYHGSHNTLIGAHRKGHIISRLGLITGFFNYNVKINRGLRDGVLNDTTILYKSVAELDPLESTIHFTVINSAENIIEIVSEDHYPHPPQ